MSQQDTGQGGDTSTLANYMKLLAHNYYRHTFLSAIEQNKVN